jgi:hypothetical protein
MPNANYERISGSPKFSNGSCISSYDGTANCKDTVGHNTLRMAEVIIFLKNE